MKSALVYLLMTRLKAQDVYKRQVHLLTCPV